MNYKKNLMLLLVLVMTLAGFTGCGNKVSNEAKTENTVEKTAVTETSPKEELVIDMDVVIYPAKISPDDKRFDDLIEILQVAMEKTKATYGEYELKPSDIQMTEERSVSEMTEGDNLNVMWRSYVPDLEKKLLAIYVPLRKGILGYRIFLIREEDQIKFSSVTTAEDLKKYSVGQGADWSDVQVFEHNGYNVVTGISYEGLFEMLSVGRFDYFSRGINEAFKEYEDRKDLFPNMRVENDLLLYYPWPYIFYVSPKAPHIAERLNAGLEIMIEDGSFDQIFEKYNREMIEKANLDQRRLLMIDNPLMENSPFDLDDEKLWFVPGK